MYSVLVPGYSPYDPLKTRDLTFGTWSYLECERRETGEDQNGSPPHGGVVYSSSEARCSNVDVDNDALWAVCHPRKTIRHGKRYLRRGERGSRFSDASGELHRLPFRLDKL